MATTPRSRVYCLTDEEKSRARGRVSGLVDTGSSYTRALTTTAEEFGVSKSTIIRVMQEGENMTGPTPQGKEEEVSVEQVQRPKFRARISADLLVRKVLGRKAPQGVVLKIKHQQDPTIEVVLDGEIVAEWEE